VIELSQNALKREKAELVMRCAIIDTPRECGGAEGKKVLAGVVESPTASAVPDGEMFPGMWANLFIRFARTV
jgi:hypothetical protein